MKGTTLIRKQITMVALVFALALAVYLNWRFAQTSEGSLPVTEVIASQDEQPAATEDAEKYYGEALFVSTDNSAYSDDYFTEARLSRSKTRDEALDTLQKSLKKTDLTEAEKNELTAQLTKTASAIATEGSIESQVKAKGFEDCVTFVTIDKVKLVVKSGSAGLSSSEVSQIKEIVLDECEIGVESINIVEIK